jgi:hypothetical protein
MGAPKKNIRVFPVKRKAAPAKFTVASLIMPWLFKHLELIDRLDSSPTISQKKLINILNHIHFTDGHLFVHMKEIEYGEDILIPVSPEPCFDGAITCRWLKGQTPELEKHQLQNLIILDGLSVVVAPIKPKSITREHFTAHMPEKAYLLGMRKARRYYCNDIRAELIQSGFVATGFLLDFNSMAFRIGVNADLDTSFHWLNPEKEATVNLYQGDRIIFSGPCQHIRQTSSIVEKEIVLAPIENQINRFRKKKTRSARMKLTPAPNVTFCHPFFEKTIQRNIRDISITGFSVYEEANEGVLIPGMIIPELNINFSGNTSVKCTAQVIYRRTEKGGYVRCGIAILDMDVRMFGFLANILFNVTDPHVHVDDQINIDALWEFFFATNFLYPKKYKHVQSYRNDFKKTYQNLYRNNPEIAANITYQKNGKIYGHVSMVKAYERAWMIHHLAARSLENNNIGLPMLKQIMYYFEGFYRLPSLKMDHWICYFRPDNRFMDLFFRGFVMHLNNPQACSLDLYAYKDYPVTATERELPEGWLLKEFSDDESGALERFYRNHSGGLLLNMLRPGLTNSEEESLEKLYGNNHFNRKWKAFSLTYLQELKAFLIVNQSDFGLNLSELLNGIKIVVTDPTGLPWDILSNAIDLLTNVYEADKIPILIYPHTYLENNDVSFEKRYSMLIMDMQYGREFIEYMQDKMNRKFRFLIKYLIGKYIKK